MKTIIESSWENVFSMSAFLLLGNLLSFLYKDQVRYDKKKLEKFVTFSYLVATINFNCFKNKLHLLPRFWECLLFLTST